MPVIFSTIWKIYEPLAALLAPMLAALLIGVWISDAAQIRSLNGQITTLHGQIDDPNTGFRAQLARVNNNLATVHANERDLEAALDKQNAAVAALQAAGKAATDRANAAAALAAANVAKANSLAQALAAQRPQNGTYADLAKLITGRAP